MNGAVAVILLFLKGVAMGAADVVPGVSGGTIAFITGIYEKLLDSIRAFTPQLFKLWRKQGIASVWRQVNGGFLVTLFSGILLSIVSLAKLISYLLSEYPQFVWSFFFGLIMVSAWIIGRQIKDRRPLQWIAMVMALVVAYVITLLTPAQAELSGWFIFLSGSIAICAMILPGISGSFILLLLGMYSHVIQAIKSFDVSFLALFSVGCLVGLLSFSHLLSWMFRRYHDFTLAVLTGFMLGSLNKVWPWKYTVSTRINSHGEVVPLIQENVLPNQFHSLNGQDPQLIYCVFLMVVGFVVVYLLERAFANRSH